MKSEVQAVSTTPAPTATGADLSLATRHGASIADGLLKHGEHFPDLILVQGATKDRRFFDTYAGMIRELCAGIERGSMTVNEKVDGFAAVMLGLNPKDRPFLATKHGFDRKSQKLLSSLAGVDKAYSGNPEMRKMFRECVRFLVPRLAEVLTGEFKDLVIQGDIVFTTSKSKKDVGEHGIRFTPNAVQYTVPPGDPLFSRVEQAFVGVVIHTVYTRSVDSEGKRVEVTPHPDQRLVERLAERLSSPGVAVLHPWRDSVRFPEISDFRATMGARVQELLSGIEDRLKLLSDDFIAAWNTTHLDKVRVFINSGVNPPMHGGLFKAVRGGEPFDYDKFVTGMKGWLEKKAGREAEGDRGKEDSYTTYRAKFDELVASHPTELRAMLGAFYAAVEAQDALIPHLKPALASRFGGEPGEGFMLRSGGMVVKFIDRLDFTMRNNARWRGALPEPFNEWHPGMRIIPMKLQPMHAGHVAMIREVAAEADGAPVIVLASRKEPNTRGKTYRALKAAETKGDLAKGEYTHLFSRALRSKLFEAADLGGARVCLMDTKILESYLAKMHEKRAEGEKIKLVTGAKESGTDRYGDILERFGHLIEQAPQPMQAGGISGTMVRDALKRYATSGDQEALATLHQAVGYVENEKKRAALIERMCVEFRKVERAAQKILATTPKRRAKKSKES